MSTQLVLISPKKKSSLTWAKFARAVGIFVLGFVVFATKHAIQQRQAEEQKLVRRSAADLVYQTSTMDKEDKQISKEISSKLRLGLYIRVFMELIKCFYEVRKIIYRRFYCEGDNLNFSDDFV